MIRRSNGVPDLTEQYQYSSCEDLITVTTNWKILGDFAKKLKLKIKHF